MGRMLLGMGLILILVLPLPASAEHNPLLPRPRKIQYGPGGLALHGLAIRLPTDASPEDRFTAQELSSSLTRIAETSIPVLNTGASGTFINLQRTGGVDPLPTPGETAGSDCRESFSIKVTPTGAEVQGRSSAAVYYGALTLLQLVEDTGAQARLPEVEIHDWPSLAYRGVMVDTSHGPLPTEAEVKRQIDFLARWKINQYYLYSEASIALEGYPLLSPDAQFSQDEIRRLVAYARERHVDVVPCMELYGHLHDLFRVERYADLAILPHGSEFDPRNPQVAALLSSWVEQLTGLFPSPFFHIGFDETGEAPVVAVTNKVTAATLYLEQFRLVSGLIQRRGKTLLVWSDMFARYPDLIPQIPAGTIVVPWGYDRTVYEPYWKPFENSSLPRFIATGVSIWDQVAPSFDLSFDNIDSFMARGRQHGVSGLINTLWTDDIAVLIRPAFPGIAYGGIAAWQSDPVKRATFFAEYAGIMYGGAAAEAAPGLAALDRAEVELARAVGGEWEETSPSFWDDPLTPEHLARAAAQREHFRQTRLLAEDAEEHLSQALRLGGDPSTLSDLLLDARLLDYAGMKNLYAAEMASFWRELGSHPDPRRVTFYLSGESSSHDHSRIEDLMDYSGDLQQAYRAAWLDSYTPYRLGTVMGKWNSEFQYWWKLQRRFHDFAEAFRQGDALPSLESFSPGY
ncbi:MAG TPA: family 20 glycosylhydrolase [Terriglobia bacterium]|nr:family 20 glycosylhydrolase [Terriglobia bacterium]